MLGDLAPPHATSRETLVEEARGIALISDMRQLALSLE